MDSYCSVCADGKLEKIMSVSTDWWQSLDRSERARIIVPFIQLVNTDKCHKPPWEHITAREMDLLLGLVREAHNQKALK